MTLDEVPAPGTVVEVTGTFQGAGPGRRALVGHRGTIAQAHESSPLVLVTFAKGVQRLIHRRFLSVVTAHHFTVIDEAF